MQALILAAGFGTRMGHDRPKALIPWHGGTVVDHQLGNLEKAGVHDVRVVTGFMAQEVEAHVASGWPAVRFTRNPVYMDTNTAKSMLLGLRDMPPGPVLSLNGDVVFDPDVLSRLLDDPETTSFAVVPGVCGAEEIKYKTRDGRLLALSKEVHGEGEAVGINLFAAADRPVLERALEYVDDQAYFERAVEHMLPYTHRPARCVPVGDVRAIELDFPEDLEEARRRFGS